jgi:hypothetical protein
MGEYLEKLISLAGPALGPPEPSCEEVQGVAGHLAAELRELLRQRNGFYAFESSLHVFPSGATETGQSLEAWNSYALWRDAFDDMTAGCVFFAEDVFGGQFCIRAQGVYTFDPETGGLEILADSLEGWAQGIISDYEVILGFPLAHTWQQRHGPLAPGRRLVPKTPFVLGGEFAIGNLRSLEATKAMRYRGDIATQIRDLPDGAQIRLDVID